MRPNTRLCAVQCDVFVTEPTFSFSAPSARTLKDLVLTEDGRGDLNIPDRASPRFRGPLSLD